MDQHMDSHLRDQRAENAEFLMDAGGLTLEQAARRLEVDADSLERDLLRRKRRGSDGEPHPDAEPGQGEGTGGGTLLPVR